MSDSASRPEETASENARAAFRTGKKLSKQEVVEEPYDSGLCLKIGSDDRETIASEAKLAERIEKTGLSPVNISRGVPPRSHSSRPKLLVRSQALSGEDDAQYALRFTGIPALGNTTRSSASSLSIESSQDVYTDSTGIDLHSFIVNTLHKNLKDRQMLLQLEQQMTALINDSSRNSQKFPVMSSYNRMLVHRVAAFFGLDHNVDQSGTAVVVNKNPQTRIPGVEFSALIRSGTFTDEPRRYLKRNVQSYEEGRQCLGSDLMAGRRAHSFDVSECAAGTGIQASCQLPVTPIQMNVFSLPASNSSSDIAGQQLLESPGSCYSYGEVQSVSVRPPIDGNAMYSGYPLPQVYSWNSSENYTNFTPSSEMPPTMIASPVPSSSRAPMLGALRNIKKAASIDTERSLHTNPNGHLAGDQRTAPLRRSMTVRQPSIPEHATVPVGGPESRDFTVPSWQPSIYDASCIEPSSSNQFFIGPQYAAAQQYVQCVPASISNARPDLQPVTQQMDALCVSEAGELNSPQVYTYQLPPQNSAFPQQVQIPGSLCQTQQYFVSVVPQGYMVANPQQPPVCRYGNVQTHCHGGEYSPAPHILCSEVELPKTTVTVPSSVVEQL